MPGKIPFLRIAFLIISYCLFSNFSKAQLKGDAFVDSLKQSLQTSKEDTTKAKALARIARFYSANDTAMASTYAKQAMKLSRKLNYQKGIGLVYQALASVHYSVSDYATSIDYAQKAQDIFVKINDVKNIGLTYNTLGINQSDMGNYVKAIEYYFKSLHCFESINETQSYSPEIGNIGVCYYYLKQYDKAIEYYKKALSLEYRKDDAFGIASGLDNIAIVYLDEGKLDSANEYDLKAIPYFIKSKNMPGLGRVYANRGNILTQMHDAAQAYEYYLKSLAISKKFNVDVTTASNYGNIGDLYLRLANDSASKFKVAPFMKMSKIKLLDSSKYYLSYAIAEAKKLNDQQTVAVFDTLLSTTEEKLGNYKAALAAFKESSMYNDSIFNDQNKQKLQALETARLTEEKDQQIKLLNQQKALEASEVKRQTLIRNIIIGAVLTIAILTFMFIFLYNRRKKSQFDKTVMDVEMKALRAQMNPHFIFNSLHSISRYVMENDKEKTLDYLSKFANLMRLTLENSREQEVPLEKDLQALELYIQLEALRFKNSFSYSIEVDPQLDQEDTLITPLLLQPFVENAIIHGVHDNENGLINIRINKEKNEMICCVIDDNGDGLKSSFANETGSQKKHTSLGKKIINERLNIINQLKKAKASVNIFDKKMIDSNTSGMRVELLLPLELAF